MKHDGLHVNADAAYFRRGIQALPPICKRLSLDEAGNGELIVRLVVTCSLGLMLIPGVVISEARAADDTKVLLGSWSGKATAPDGGPPSGNIQITFARGENGVLRGKIMVKAEGGLEYSGEVSEVKLERRIVSAKAVFKLGESPVEADVSGPLKGRKIEGTFFVISKGEKIGEGTFSITKDAPAGK